MDGPFVFKIQANMDQRHRDRIAYVRVCSGYFDKGSKVFNTRTGRFYKLAAPTSMMAQDKSVVDRAFAGDIIGIHDAGHYCIGDTVTNKDPIEFEGMPE